MDRARIHRELGRVRGLVAGIGMAGIAVGSVTLLGCTLRCHPSAMLVAEPAGIEREAGESDESLRMRCIEVCRSRRQRADTDCAIDADDPPMCTWSETQACIAGRAPVGGFAHSVPCGANERDAYLRTQVAFELASVFAFEDLAESLAAWEANLGFIRAAARFADDERRHALRLFASIDDDDAVYVQPATRGPADLAAFARHNAAEACIGETFGARIAAHQARHAPDATLRSTYAGIARDEADHARFAFALDRWARTRLSRVEAQAIDDAYAASVSALRATLDTPLGPDGLGLPSPREARAIFDALFA